MASAGGAKHVNREMRHGFCTRQNVGMAMKETKVLCAWSEEESLQTGWIKESFTERVTLELGVGKQV